MKKYILRIKYDFDSIERLDALKQFNGKKILALNSYIDAIIFYDFTILYFYDYHYSATLGHDFSKKFPDDRVFNFKLTRIDEDSYKVTLAKDIEYNFTFVYGVDDYSEIEAEQMRKDKAIKFIQDSEKKYGKISNHQKLILMANINKLR